MPNPKLCIAVATSVSLIPYVTILWSMWFMKRVEDGADVTDPAPPLSPGFAGR